MVVVNRRHFRPLGSRFMAIMWDNMVYMVKYGLKWPRIDQIRVKTDQFNIKRRVYGS